jgi:hypothetical protein
MAKELIDGQVVDLPLKATVGFTRKVGLPNYSNVEASIYLPVELDDSWDEAQVQAALTAALEHSKALVDAAVGGGTTEQQAVALVQEKTGATTTTQQPNDNGRRYSQDELRKLFNEDPSAFYDNREKKRSGQYKANASDAKHKASGQSLWEIEPSPAKK